VGGLLSCKALMIIGKTPLIEELYKVYIVDEYDKDYSVNIRNRVKTVHLNIKNLLFARTPMLSLLF
jgi:DNA adenine methylase